MGNHNVLITKPSGEWRHEFPENVTREEADKWLKTYGPAPQGWKYQIVNLNKPKKVNPDSVLVQGFSKDGEFIASTHARHKTNNGWYSIKDAKRDLRKQGASFFTTEKVYVSTKV